MGLVSDLVDNAFVILNQIDGDLVPSFTYRAVTLGAYDPATDTYVETIVETTVENAVRSKFKEKEVREEIFESTDRKLIFPSSSLATFPSVNDRVVIDGVVWNVEENMGVPGDSLRILRIREV